jgi:hypothetical protein
LSPVVAVPVAERSRAEDTGPRDKRPLIVREFKHHREEYMGFEPEKEESTASSN